MLLIAFLLFNEDKPVFLNYIVFVYCVFSIFMLVYAYQYKYILTEIVSRVCGRETPPFRPVVMPGGAGAGPELLELAERCWAESPDDRPSFDTINANYIK